MTVYTNEAAKKTFKNKYRPERIEKLQESINMWEKKAAWMRELIEEKRSTKRRKPISS